MQHQDCLEAPMFVGSLSALPNSGAFRPPAEYPQLLAPPLGAAKKPLWPRWRSTLGCLGRASRSDGRPLQAGPGRPEGSTCGGASFGPSATPQPSAPTKRRTMEDPHCPPRGSDSECQPRTPPRRPLPMSGPSGTPAGTRGQG